MVNEPTEKELADLAKKLGLNEPKFDSNSSDKSGFQGDFGYSIDLRFLFKMPHFHPTINHFSKLSQMTDIFTIIITPLNGSIVE